MHKKNLSYVAGKLGSLANGALPQLPELAVTSAHAGLPLSLQLLCLHPVSAENPILVLWSCSFLFVRARPCSSPVDGSMVAHKTVWQR